MTLIDRLIPIADAVLLSVRTTVRACEGHVRQVTATIRAIRGGKKKATFERHAAVADTIIRDFRHRGKIYYDGSAGYVFFHDSRRLIRLERGDELLELELASYGLAPTEQVTKQTTEILRLEALARGERVTVYQLSHYNPDTNVLYVFDFDCGVYRIDAEGIQHVDNGTDAVLFVQSANRQSFALEGRPICADGEWRGWLVGGARFAPGKLSAEQQKALCVLWVLALFFGMRTRVILAAIGEKGSGKSSLLRLLGILLFGAKFDVMPLASKSDDFDVAITNDVLVVADNVDDAPSWFNDKVAVAATGGTVKKRILYSNNREGLYPITASLAVTSRTPAFTRDDVADRMMPIYFERIEDGFRAESDMLDDAIRRRNQLWASLLGDLHQVVRAFERTKGREYRTRLRMADFARLVLRLADAQDRIGEAEALLDALAAEQFAFANEAGDEPLYRVLDEWLRRDSPIRNLEREISTQCLATELNQVAEEMKERWTVRNGWALGQILIARHGALRDRFGARFREGRARMRFWTFTKLAGESGENESR